MTLIDSITLDKVSKRYGHHWILRNVDYRFDIGTIYAVKGDNGSGKSTLLKMLSGYLTPTVGDLRYYCDGHTIPQDKLFLEISLWGPYVSLIKNLTLREMISYYLDHKAMREGDHVNSIFDALHINVSLDALVRSLSSGQAQRLGLYLAIHADTPLLLLDEPGSYLDREGKDWLQDQILRYSSNRIVVIASNEDGDMKLADESIIIKDYH